MRDEKEERKKQARSNRHVHLHCTSPIVGGWLSNAVTLIFRVLTSPFTSSRFPCMVAEWSLTRSSSCITLPLTLLIWLLSFSIPSVDFVSSDCSPGMRGVRATHDVNTLANNPTVCVSVAHYCIAYLKALGHDISSNCCYF